MNSTEKIKALIQERNSILRTLADFEKYSKTPSHYDKTGKGFNIDSRFAAHNGLTLRVDSWCGTYGNSSCGREFELTDDIFNRHLLKVLNDDFDNIMKKVAESIRQEALKLKKESVEKLEKDLDLIQSLDS